MTTTRPGLLNQYFYLFMSLLIAAVVIYGFSQTIDQNLIHAAPPRPWLLYLHGAVFSAWVIFFIVQSALVRTRNVRVHRKLGWFGVGLGRGFRCWVLRRLSRWTDSGLLTFTKAER